MTHLATVLIAAEDDGFATALLERLERSGYRGRSTGSGADALAFVQRELPDILLIGQTLTDMTPLALAEAVKRDDSCAIVPVVMLADSLTPGLALRALEAGVDDVLADPFDHVVMVPRIRPLLRLSTMYVELRQRALVARDLGINAATTAPRTIEAGQPEILLIGHQTDAVRDMLEGVTVSVTDNLYEAEDLLTARNFDAAVLVCDGNVEAHVGFCSHVRNNPRLFNLPVLLIDATEGRLDLVDAYRRGASRVLRQPIDANVLRSAALTLVRRQKRHWALRRALQETLAAPSRDALTGAYNRDFLMRYLARRLALAKTGGRLLSVLFFYIPSVDGTREQFGDEAADHLLVQLGQWIGGLLRGEDITARFEGNEFCVVLPDTPREEADRVMNRIAGVLSYTDFAVKDVYMPVKVWVQAGCAVAQADDTIDLLLARARSNLY